MCNIALLCDIISPFFGIFNRELMSEGLRSKKISVSSSWLIKGAEHKEHPKPCIKVEGALCIRRISAFVCILSFSAILG